MRARSLLFVVPWLAAAAMPPIATGATSLGEVFAPDNCGGNVTYFQTGSPAGPGQYTVPSPGVITAWRYQANAATGPVRLKLAQPAAGTTFRIVGESALETSVVASSVNPFPTRIQAQPGDVLGLYIGAMMGCIRSGVSAAYVGQNSGPGDFPPGTDVPLSAPISGIQYEVAATLEPDADGDGFGDESQDLCATNPATQGTCPPAAPTRPSTKKRSCKRKKKGKAAAKKCKRKKSKKKR